MRAIWLPGLFALLGTVCVVPAPAADEPTQKEFQTAANRLKELGIAFHTYGDNNGGKWADDITDKDGRPLLSWRVALLPHIEGEKLYKEFKLDEPWDSEHNKKLIAKMPPTYQPVRGKAKPGETFLQRFVGKDALFNENGSDYKISTVPDGTSNTALVVEADDPVVWTKPLDLTFIPKAPLPKLGGPFNGPFHVLFGDGSVQLFKKDFDVNEMKNVIMPADGNVINFDKLQK